MSIEVERLEGRRGVGRFVDARWKIFPRPPAGAGVPPLRVAVKQMLDRRDPFYERAHVELFLARRGGHPVGRIAAVENPAHNERFADRVGFFGFFECVDDPEVAATLLATAEGWLAGRGLTVARGPVSPSLNHECGLLVEGFEERHVALTTWNPAYYRQLLESAGYRGVQDLVAYDIPVRAGFPGEARLARLAEGRGARLGVRFRAPELADFEAEIRALLPVFQQAWAGNWGFVPPSLEEFRHLAAGLKPLLRADFSVVAEVDGRAVAFLLNMADLNRLVPRASSGRLTPRTLARLLVAPRRLRAGRLILMGVLPEYRHGSLLPVMLHRALVLARQADVERVEASWILEDNRALRAPLEALGLAPYRRWRIFDRPLPGAAAGRTTSNP